VRNGCCYHGLAFNVDSDPAAFEAIDPCGYPGLAVTSARKLGIMAPLPSIGEALAENLRRRLDS
jgi:lipoyl(octanoyl) transferase